MSLFVAKDALLNDLKKASQGWPDRPVLIHSDLFQIGPTRPPKNRLEICHDYEEILFKVFKDKPLLIPTFHCLFCKTGKYDIVQSPSEVGALGEYFRQKYPQHRTPTPIFNFVILHDNSKTFNNTPPKNVFGPESTFGQLHKKNATIAFLGAPFSSNTFIHYVEEALNIGYRYLKKFHGLIIEKNQTRPITVEYRCRPLEPDIVQYDWTKLAEEAEKANILKSAKAGHGKLLSYQATDLFNFWSDKIKQDEFYLLSESSKQKIHEYIQSKGYPFQKQMFEKPEHQ